MTTVHPVIGTSSGKVDARGSVTPSSGSTSEADGRTHILKSGNGHGPTCGPHSEPTSGLNLPVQQGLLAPVELRAKERSPALGATALSQVPGVSFTTASETVKAGGRTYQVVGHCAHGPIVILERDAKSVEEPEEEPEDECTRRLYHLNPSPLFGIGFPTLYSYFLMLHSAPSDCIHILSNFQ